MGEPVTRRMALGAAFVAAAVPKAAAAAAMTPGTDDAALVALGRQFDAIAAEILAFRAEYNASVERRELEVCRRLGIEASQSSLNQEAAQRYVRLMKEVGDETGAEAAVEQMEAILARLDPIERAIIATPACTLVGLGVKARHAAHVVSQHWDEPIEKADWRTRTVRLLIEAVCEVARVSLPFRNSHDAV